jgi:hypothetical protein
MTQDQINVTTMHSATATYMDQNNSIWSGNAAMSAAVAQLKANNGVIAQKRNTQETATEGVQAQAVQARHDLEDKILEIADQIYALAASTNNPSLEEQSHFTQAQLDGMDPDKLLQTGANVAALATANLAGLADYGVTAADVTALTAAGTTFTPLKNAYRDAVSKKSGQTRTIPQAIAGNQSLLKKQMDKQMTKFKNSNPDFYAGYLTARGIVGRRSHHAGKAAPQAAAQPQK